MDRSETPSLFVTGATGFLGRHFLYWQRQKPFRFIVLVRGEDEKEARERYLTSVKIACDAYRTPFDRREWSDRSTVLVGDICKPLCGLSEETVAWLRTQDIPQFWHFAASLNFGEKSQKKIWQQNVEGAANVLNLTTEAKIPFFYYCSTAYSVGKADGMIEEVLHPLPRSFNNLYEESKCVAEHEVARFCGEKDIGWAILRPSIVIGPRSTKSTGGSTTGLYGFLLNLFKLKKMIQAIEHPITIIGNPETKLNLIPVDDLMQDVAGFTQTGVKSGSILHLTSSWCPDLRKAVRYTSELMGIQPLQIARAATGERSPVEQLMDSRTQFHSSYLNSVLEFNRSLPRRYGVDDREFAGFITEAYRAAGDEAAPRSVFTPHLIDSFDGAQIKVYSAGDPSKPAIVLANAIGMPVEFWSGFARQLAADFFVLTWESRGCPNADLVFDPDKHAFDHHTQDLLTVLDRFGVGSASVVGWCSGAQIALRAAGTHPDRIRRVVSVNGSFGVTNGVDMTQFEVKMREVMPKIATDRRLAEMYFNVVYGNAEGTEGIDPAEAREKAAQASTVLTSVDPALLHLTSRPFESVESLFRYSRLITASLNEDVNKWVDKVTVPVLLYTGSRDQTAHPDCTKWVAKRLSKAWLLVDDDADHFTFYKEPSVLDRVSRFLHQGVN